MGASAGTPAFLRGTIGDDIGPGSASRPGILLAQSGAQSESLSPHLRPADAAKALSGRHDTAPTRTRDATVTEASADQVSDAKQSTSPQKDTAAGTPGAGTGANEASASTAGTAEGTAEVSTGETEADETAPGKTAAGETATGETAPDETAPVKKASGTDTADTKAVEPKSTDDQSPGKKTADTKTPANMPSAEPATKQAEEQATPEAPKSSDAPPTPVLKARTDAADDAKSDTNTKPATTAHGRPPLPLRNPEAPDQIDVALPRRNPMDPKARAKAAPVAPEDLPPPKRRVVYITLDDGPLNGTRNALRIFQEEKTPVSFFLVGRHAEQPEHQALMKELKAEKLVSIANHSYSHADGRYQRFYMSPSNVLSDLDKANPILGIDQGPDSARKLIHCRLPGRNVFRVGKNRKDDGGLKSHVTARERLAYAKVANARYQLYGWDIEWRSAGRSPRESPEAIIDNIDRLIATNKTFVRGRVMMLAHDYMFQSNSSAEQLRRLIRGLKRKGYEIKPIEDYKLVSTDGEAAGLTDADLPEDNAAPVRSGESPVRGSSVPVASDAQDATQQKADPGSASSGSAADARKDERLVGRGTFDSNR